MMRRLFAAFAMLIALLAAPTTSAQTPPALSPPQLDQLVAPIALYPDALLGDILMAATYPLEVVEAARWLQDSNHAGLRGDQLALILQAEDWDPSVKALVPFPQVIQWMDSRLGWMQQLGDAFLAQQNDVMDAVQRLRARAQAAGTLNSTPQEIVSTDGTATTIEPANPGVLYVPAYDPTVVYGPWPYPDYPPYYFAPYPGYDPLVGGIAFGIGVAVVGSLWGWQHWDWHGHEIHIDRDRFGAIDRYSRGREGRSPPPIGATWTHDPFHRRGIAYRDVPSQQKFLGAPGGSPEARRPFRGFDEGTAPHGGGGATAGRERGGTAAPGAAVPPRHYPPAPDHARQAPRTDTQPPRNSPPAAAPAPPVVRAAPPPAQRMAPFDTMERGAAVRQDAERGRASRVAPMPAPQPQAAPRQAQPAQRGEPPHGGAPGRSAGRRER